MKVELLYFSGCANWRVARERLAHALQLTGHTDQRIELVVVVTEEQAQQLRFPGSPTIRIGGGDLFPRPEQRPGLSCRLYATAEGVDGAPSLAQLVEAVGGACP
ncbi:DF family (seleno)protein [Salinactinospora qingdaonensis]|uniref:Thioredoxin family protein n=1 Tax=Salinactinospora qingdaonensis TaxID=702744 RepID=A0ABP7GAH7_9ACTN